MGSLRSVGTWPHPNQANHRTGDREKRDRKRVMRQKGLHSQQEIRKQLCTEKAGELVFDSSSKRQMPSQEGNTMIVYVRASKVQGVKS